MSRTINWVILSVAAAGLMTLGAGGAQAQNLNTPSIGRALTAPDQPRVEISDQKNRQLPQTAPSDTRDNAYAPDATSTYKVDGGVNKAAPPNDNNPYSGPDSVKVNNDAEAMQVPPGIPAVEPPIGVHRHQGESDNTQAVPPASENSSNPETNSNLNQNAKPGHVLVKNDAEAMQVPPGIPAIEPVIGTSARIVH